MKQHPVNNFEFDETAELEFNKWFYTDLYGLVSYRYEYFTGDVETEELNQRKDALISWLHSAFVSGYECALYSKLEEEQKDT